MPERGWQDFHSIYLVICICRQPCGSGRGGVSKWGLRICFFTYLVYVYKSNVVTALRFRMRRHT